MTTDIIPTISDIYRGAADDLDRFGWTTGTAGSEYVGFCMLGAMRHTMGLDPCDWSADDEWNSPTYPGTPEQEDAYRRAVQFLREQMDMEPYRFNDRSGFTNRGYRNPVLGKAEVTAKLREMATIAEGIA